MRRLAMSTAKPLGSAELLDMATRSLRKGTAMSPAKSLDSMMGSATSSAMGSAMNSARPLDTAKPLEQMSGPSRRARR